MPIEITMPALSPTMKEGNLVKWNIKEGDKIFSGDVIAEIETDKAVMEVEASEEGILGKIIIDAGAQGVKIGALIALILEDGETAASIKSYKPTTQEEPAKEEPAKKAPAKEESASKTPPVSKNTTTQTKTVEVQPTDQKQNFAFVSPLARRTAQENNININEVQGTGPNGRIIKNDVLNHTQKPNFANSPSPQSAQNAQTKKPLNPVTIISGVQRKIPEQTEVQNTGVRKVIANRLLESKQTIPHFYLSIDVVLTELSKLRAQVNKSFETQSLDAKLSINDFIIKASALALKDWPSVNASWNDSTTIMHNNVDVSVAVTTPSGLLTPIIKNADMKNMLNISTEMKDLAVRAKNDKLSPEEFQGGSFTISNLGMYKIKAFNAIINPPQSAILSIGAATETPYLTKDKEVKMQSIMNISLSCDHRVIDGVLGAEFLNAIKNYLENPSIVMAL